MKVNFTKRMLLAVSLAGGLTVATAASVMPEHLAKLQRVENVSKFKSVPKQTLEAAEECAVFIQLPEDLQGWMPDICAACAPDKPLVEPNGDYLYLAPGTYDIVARFIHSNPMSFTFNDYQGYVVLENVEVSGDMTVSVDPATITHNIEFLPLLPDGSPVVLPVINLDENGNEIPVSDGSMPFLGLTIIDFIAGPGWGIDKSNTMSALINAETPWGFYDPTRWFGIRINEVSDRIHLGIAAELGTPEYDLARNLLMSAEQAGSQDGVISNDPSAYVVREFNPAWTPDGVETESLIEEYPDQLGWVSPYGYALRRMAGKSNRLTGGAIRTDSKNPEIYKIAFSRNNITDPYVHFLVAPTKTELVKSGSDVIQTVNYGAWMQPFDEGEWIVYPGSDLAMTAESPTAEFPFWGVESFLTPAADNGDVMFLTAPLLSTTIKRGFNMFEGTEYLGFSITSAGRLNETRNSDLSLMKAELFVNATKVANSMEAIDEWWKNYESDMAGEIELKLTDTNFEVDGNRTATVSISHFDMNKADFFPPSATMMQVRTNEGKLSSCVAPGLDNVIVVSAGDFEAGNEMVNYYGQTATVTSEPSSFSLWYAPAGTEEWVELDCTKVNEEVIAGIGMVYEAVFNSDVQGWKDIKIRVEDAAGNWQEQVVGMAVYVAEGTGVKTVSDNGKVIVEGNTIIAPAGARIYTVDGVTTNGADLAPGLYIVCIDGVSCKVAVK
ncbi:MAG: hypothetical protein K2H22_08930 [Muribaculaceae bacterium]|nr:hypothetical protein [Muribaculaceae bacterium]